MIQVDGGVVAVVVSGACTVVASGIAGRWARKAHKELQGNGTGVPVSQSMKVIKEMLTDLQDAQDLTNRRLSLHTESKELHK